MADEQQRNEWDSMILGYATGNGSPQLRAAVAQLHDTISPDDVLSCVPDEGIFLTLMALLSRGDEVIVTVPAYASLFEICQAQGCTLVPWIPVERSDAEGELWFDPEEMNSLITSRTRLVVTNFREQRLPHGPFCTVACIY